jgi:hypothetical protein
VTSPRQQGLRRVSSTLTDIARAGEWWEYKLVPIFAMFYATALISGAPLHSLWLAAVTLLAALVPGAIYVSVVNDLTDREEDAAAGKRNRLAGKSAPAAALLLALPIAAGIAFMWLWRDDPLLLIPYLAAWFAFSLYSLPPFRLKARGVAGVFADASGAHLFPTFLAVALAYRASGTEPNAVWLTATSLWALAYGLRGILWHQLLDADADRTAAVRTFVAENPRQYIVRLARYVVFPVEICAFAIVLSQVPSYLPMLFLFGYALLVKRRIRLFQQVAVIVEPRPRYLIILHEYYDLFLPVALLLACVWRSPLDAVALLLHFLLFPGRLIMTSQDLWKLRPFT